MGRNNGYLVLALLLLVLCVSCDKEQEPLLEDTTEWETRTVAVVLPMQNGLDVHWKRTLNQCADDLKKAFEGQTRGIVLEYEWYDEDKENLTQLADDLGKRKEVVAVIGGFRSDNAKALASRFCRSGVRKTFFTLATTEELVRGFSSAGCLWAMTETDIAQCEVLLAKAYAYGAKNVGLIANGGSLYGKTFVEWFGFQAKEMGMEVTGIYNYEHSTIKEEAAKAAASGADYLICVPDEVEGVRKIVEAMHRQAVAGMPPPRCLYSDIAYGADVIATLGEYANGIEGVCVGADPETGFDIRYEITYGEQPTNGEAQAYDAAMMIGYACYLQLLSSGLSLNEAVKELVDGHGEYQYTWSTKGMKDFIIALTHGEQPNLRGVSGSLDFDKKVYTNVLSSTYYNYIIYNGRYVILDYNSSNGSVRTDATLAGWNWKNNQMQEFSDSDLNEIKYPELDEKWAILISASKGWSNYRHQADVYNMYQLLRSYGYDDEHIVLIAEDDIAYHQNNPTPGVVSTHISGKNVYKDIIIDYHPSELNSQDIKAILCGEKSDKLNQVLSADLNDNVFLFWSGHGTPGQLKWLDKKDGYTYDYFKDVFISMCDKKCYRKMLCLVETCYSGSVFNAVESIPGILAFTASDANETSKADIYNCDLEVWMTNRFTSSFMDALNNRASLTLYELYTHMFKNTVGSHVMIYNNQNYGNLHRNLLDEFITIK